MRSAPVRQAFQVVTTGGLAPGGLIRPRRVARPESLTEQQGALDARGGEGEDVFFAAGQRGPDLLGALAVGGPGLAGIPVVNWRMRRLVAPGARTASPEATARADHLDVGLGVEDQAEAFPIREWSSASNTVIMMRSPQRGRAGR